MKYKVIGWTYYDNEEILSQRGTIGFAERNAIIDEIRKHKYLFTGYDHQEGYNTVPILNDGRARLFSQRGFGGLMAEAYNKNTEDIIDFSSNINPNVIPNLEQYILEGLNKCKSYPDINYTKLRRNIGNYINVNPQYIIPGNGATEIIYLLMKTIEKRLAILNPTFSEYERGAKLNNLELINFMLNKDDEFSVNLEEIEANIDSFDSLFICNPNNPNGKVKNIEELLKLIIKNNKLLIVDETFMEFVHEEENYSLIKYVERYKNIFIIKAVTKFFGMPGIRLGYGVTSNKKLIDGIYRYKEPWTVNSFADTLSNYILISNAWSCSMCMSASIKAKIQNYIFGAKSESNMNPNITIFDIQSKTKNNLNIITDILDNECAKQMEDARNR